MRVAQIERHLVGTLRRPDVDLHSFRPMRTWDPSAPHRAATDGRARSGWPITCRAFRALFTWRHPFMNDFRSLWRVVVNEARIFLGLLFQPVTCAWRWLRRGKRR